MTIKPLLALGLAAALLAAAPARADQMPFGVEVENYWVAGGIATVVMKVTNRTNRAARQVRMLCKFLDRREKAIDIGKATITVIPAYGVAYEKATTNRAKGIVIVNCDAVDADFQ